MSVDLKKVDLNTSPVEEGVISNTVISNLKTVILKNKVGN